MTDPRLRESYQEKDHDDCCDGNDASPRSHHRLDRRRLIAGWLANKVVKVEGGGGYGVVANLALGVIGALVGGVAFRLLDGGEDGFWGSLVLALLGATILLAGVRGLALGRKV